MIGAPVCVNQQAGDEFRPGWLDQDVNLLGSPCPTLRIANDPADCISGRDRARPDELLTVLQGDVGDLARCRVDLIESALGKRIDLDRVEICAARWLDACGRV